MKNLKKTILPILLAILMMTLAACTTDTVAPEKDPATMDKIETNIHTSLKDYLLSVNDTLTEEDFADGEIPTYAVTRIKRDSEGFNEYAESLGFDPACVEDLLHVALLMNVNSNDIIVVRTNDMVKAKEGLRAHHDTQVDIWSQYLPEQYAKVEKNVTAEKGDYLYYVTHDVQDNVVTTIKNALDGK